MTLDWRRCMSAARFDSAPITTRSGRMKVSMAEPSRRNSGFEATSNFAPRFDGRCWSCPPSNGALPGAS